MLPDIHSSSRHVWSDGIQAASVTLQHLLCSCHDFLIYHVFGCLKCYYFFWHFCYISSVIAKCCRNTQGQMGLDSPSYLNKHRHNQGEQRLQGHALGQSTHLPPKFHLLSKPLFSAMNSNSVS